MWQFECPHATNRKPYSKRNSTLVLMASTRNDNKDSRQFSACRDSVTQHAYHRNARKTQTLNPVVIPSTSSYFSSCSPLYFYYRVLIVSLLFLLCFLPLLHHNTTPLKQIIPLHLARAPPATVCLSLNSRAEGYNNTVSARRCQSSFYFPLFPSFFARAEEEKDVPVSYDSVFSEWGFVTTLDAAGMGTGVNTRSTEAREGVAEDGARKTPQSAVDGSLTLVGDSVVELVKPSVISYLYSVVAADIGQELGIPTSSVEIIRAEASRIAISLRTATATLPCVTIRFRIMSTTRISGLIVGIWASALNLTDLTPKPSTVTSALASSASAGSSSQPSTMTTSVSSSSLTLTPAHWMNGTQSLYRSVLKGLLLQFSANSNSKPNNNNNDNAGETAGGTGVSAVFAASASSSSSSVLLTLPTLSLAAAVALSPPTRPVQFLSQCGPVGCVVAVGVGTVVSWFIVAFVALTVRAALCSDRRQLTSESHRKSEEDKGDDPWDVNSRDEGSSTSLSDSCSISNNSTETNKFQYAHRQYSSSSSVSEGEGHWRGERDFDRLDGGNEQGSNSDSNYMYNVVDPHDQYFKRKHAGETYENEGERHYFRRESRPHHRPPPPTATDFSSSTHRRPAEAGLRSRGSLLLVLPKSRREGKQHEGEEEGGGRRTKEELVSESDDDDGSQISLSDRRSPTAGGRDSAINKYTDVLPRESNSEAFDYRAAVGREGHTPTQDQDASFDDSERKYRYGREGLGYRKRETNANDNHDDDTDDDDTDENGNSSACYDGINESKNASQEAREISNRRGTKSPFANYYFGNNYQRQPYL